MRTKSIALLALASGVLALGVAGFSGIEGAKAPSLYTQADSNATRSFTITASDFKNNQGGDVNIAGVTAHYDNAQINGSTVTLKSVFYTLTRSGAEKDGTVRGNGFTRIVFENFGGTYTGQVSLWDVNGNYKDQVSTISADVDLTKGDTVPANSRRGFHMPIPPDKTLSFTSATFYYECGTVSPSVTISGDDAVNVGSDLNLTANTEDIFASDSATYEWVSSDPDSLSIVGNGKTAVAHGEAGADSVTVTVTAKSGGVAIASDTFDVRVIAQAATIIEVPLKNSVVSWGAGAAGVIGLDLTGIDGVTGTDIHDLVSAKKMAVTITGISMTFKSFELENYDNDHWQAQFVYSNPPADNYYTINILITDTDNNRKFNTDAYFYGKEQVNTISIVGDNSVDIGKTLELNVSSHKAGLTVSSVVWSSSSDNIAEVSSSGVVTGMAAGQADITATITGSDGEEYVDTKRITVIDPSAEKALVPWYIGGTGDHANHRASAGLWTWVDVTELGYSAFDEFGGSKIKSLSYSTTSVTFNVWSDPIEVGGHHIGRMYLVLGAAYDGVLKVQLEKADGTKAYGSITFTSGAGGSYNQNID